MCCHFMHYLYVEIEILKFFAPHVCTYIHTYVRTMYFLCDDIILCEVKYLVEHIYNTYYIVQIAFKINFFNE